MKSLNYFSKRYLKLFAKRVSLSLPKIEIFDTFFAWLEFIQVHGRAPGQKNYSDIIYKLKTSSDITSPIRCFVSDKEFLKIFVSGTVGSQYNVPTHAVLRNKDDVIRFNYPESCCIKATHTSGNYILRKANEEIDLELVASWLGINYYLSHREANYRRLEPKIIVEPLVFGSASPPEYKYICFQGKPRLILHISDRDKDIRKTYFNLRWQCLPFELRDALSNPLSSKPGNLAEMNNIAAKIAKYFDLVRIDFYSDGSELKISEITNCDANAEAQFFGNGDEALASFLEKEDCVPLF